MRWFVVALAAAVVSTPAVGFAAPPDAAAADTGPHAPRDAGADTASASSSAGNLQQDPPPKPGLPDNPGESPSISPPDTGSSIGRMLLETLVVLAVVCLLAYALLRWGVGRLVGGSRGDDAIEILARQPVGRDSSILVVRVGPRTLVVADGESGMNRLAELDDEETEALLESGADETTPDSWVPAFLHKQGEST